MKLPIFHSISFCGLMRVGLGLFALGVTAAVAYQAGKEKAEKQAAIELDSIRHYHNIIDGGLQYFGDDDDYEPEEPPKPDLSRGRPRDRSENIDYHGISTKPIPAPQIDPDPPHVRILTRDEFYTEDKTYENQTVIYYTVDGVAVDPWDDPLEDHLNVLGSVFVTKFDEDGIAWVRNEFLNTDYEISKTDLSFAQTVLGIEEDDSDVPHKLRNGA